MTPIDLLILIVLIVLLSWMLWPAGVGPVDVAAAPRDPAQGRIIFAIVLIFLVLACLGVFHPHVL